MVVWIAGCHARSVRSSTIWPSVAWITIDIQPKPQGLIEALGPIDV
jgi:hypothetical protein